MRPVPLRVWVALALLSLAGPALAASPLPLAVGSSRDGALYDLQKKLDRYVGPGRLNARTDYIGARTGDPDPWFWVNPSRAMIVTLLDRKSSPAKVGWYSEDGYAPLVEGTNVNLIIEKATLRGDSRAVRIPSGVKRFGFYVCCTTPAKLAGGGEFTSFSNRLWNSPGPLGTGARHAPFDGDIQMLVYDVTRWVGPQTWLIACETSDSGANVGHGPEDTDNDFSDCLFTVSGVGVTPTLYTTFGLLKSRFR